MTLDSSLVHPMFDDYYGLLRGSLADEHLKFETRRPDRTALETNKVMMAKRVRLDSQKLRNSGHGVFFPFLTTDMIFV